LSAFFEQDTIETIAATAANTNNFFILFFCF